MGLRWNQATDADGQFPVVDPEERRDYLSSSFEDNLRAAIFIEADRRILFTNKAGAALLSDGEYFIAVAGRLTPAHRGDQESFVNAVRSVFSGELKTVGLVQRDGQAEALGAYSLTPCSSKDAALMTFLPPWTVGAHRAALMFQPYDLTPAEQHIAECLVSGYSLSDIAERNDISLSTVKSHVKRVYQKTLVESRVEFMNRFMLMVAVWL